MTKIYSSFYDKESSANGYANVLDSVAYHLDMTPAERATLATTGVVTINNLIDDSLVVQLEQAPAQWAAGEIVHVNDYGAARWWYNDESKTSGKVQL